MCNSKENLMASNSHLIIIEEKKAVIRTLLLIITVVNKLTDDYASMQMDTIGKVARKCVE